ncbi:g428 [Coccomyxa elongata]
MTASLQNSDEEYEDSQQSESTWLSRAQHRTEELRKLFHLPPGENVCDEFVCALRKRILLQGRLYICEHFICFYSSLFGYNKEKVIPLKEVTNVRKRRHCGFPNSIEIIWRGGKREFFTSFLSRDDAYRLVMMAWHQNSGYAKLFGALTPHESARPAALTKAGALIRSSLTGHSAGSASPAHDHSDSEKGAEGKRSRLGLLINTLTSGHIHPIGTRRNILQNGGDRGDRDVDDDASSQGSVGSFAEPKGQPLALNQPSTSAVSLDESEVYNDSDIPSDADSDAEGADEQGDDKAEWVPQPGPAPPVPPDCHFLAKGVLNADVREVFHRLLADERFFRSFHEGRDDRDIRVSPWRQHPAVGRVRELTFVSPVKMRMGISPSSAHCHQTQRYRLFEGGAHLVLESSQTMNDIPFGDHFTVESRWDFAALPPAPDGAPRTKAVNHVKIPFNKQTMWRKAIEKGTLDTCREAHTDLLAKAQKLVAAVPAVLSTIRSSSGGRPAEAAAAPGGVPATPFAGAAGAGGLPPLHRRSPTGGSGASESPDVERLLSRIPSEFRADVARMLLNSQEKAASGSGAIPRMQSAALLRSGTLHGTGHLGSGGVPSRGGTSLVHEMLAAGHEWVCGWCEPRHLLMACILLAILGLQIMILAGLGRGGGMRGALTGGEAPNQAWAQRVEAMQLELAALIQRVELLNAELAAAARVVANQTADLALTQQ